MSKKHNMHGSMGALLDDIDRMGGQLPPMTKVAEAEKAAEKKYSGLQIETSDSPNVKKAREVVSLSPDQIRPWALKNRQLHDMGDIDGLIESIRADGQHTPILVRELSVPEGNIYYEVYAGFRRWTACKELSCNVLAIVYPANDQIAAIIQETENEGREHISLASRAQHYKALLDQKVFPSEAALATALHINKSSFNDLMSYARLPTEFVEAVGNIHSLPLRFAKVLATLCKDPSLFPYVMQLVPNIAKGKVAAHNIHDRIEELATGESHQKPSTTMIRGKNMNLVRVKKDKNGLLTMSFLKEVNDLLTEQELISAIQTLLEEKIK